MANLFIFFESIFFAFYNLNHSFNIDKEKDNGVNNKQNYSSK